MAQHYESQSLTAHDTHNLNLKSLHELADQMKIATASYHRRAEQTGIVSKILKKRVSHDAYRLYLRNLYLIYTGLEKPLKRRSDSFKSVTPFLNKMVKRSQPLAQDLIHLSGDNDWQSLPLLSSSLAYRKHIDHLHADDPVSLIGHIYVRYLGDMNGGQVLERLLSESLNLSDESLNFYKYPAIHNIKSFRQSYRELFNAAPLDAHARRRVIETAIKAFEFNIDLSEDIISVVTSDE